MTKVFPLILSIGISKNETGSDSFRQAVLKYEHMGTQYGHSGHSHTIWNSLCSFFTDKLPNSDKHLQHTPSPLIT
jgi:hypothetical protein